jgi:hypothetical protein
LRDGIKKISFLIIAIHLFDNSMERRIHRLSKNTGCLVVRTHQPVEYRSINLLQYNNTIPKKNANNPYI